MRSTDDTLQMLHLCLASLRQAKEKLLASESLLMEHEPSLYHFVTLDSWTEIIALLGQLSETCGRTLRACSNIRAQASSFKPDSTERIDRDLPTARAIVRKAAHKTRARSHA